jgi:hypothetical protein
LPLNSEFHVKTKKFSRHRLTRFLFKDQAKEYGNFLKENGIDEIVFFQRNRNYVQEQDMGFVRQLNHSELVPERIRPPKYTISDIWNRHGPRHYKSLGLVKDNN